MGLLVLVRVDGPGNVINGLGSFVRGLLPVWGLGGCCVVSFNWSVFGVGCWWVEFK